MWLIDCYVDLVVEGFDLVLCIGVLGDFSLIVCCIGWIEIWVVVSFDYLVVYLVLCYLDDLCEYCNICDSNVLVVYCVIFVIEGCVISVFLFG